MGRRQSLLAVTSTLHELVNTFPMVAFQRDTQKLAVGTGDGLGVVYDLRTATKWRILEGHTAAVAALDFSENGSQLGSYSARDNKICVWECGSSGLLRGLLRTSNHPVKQHPLPALTSSGKSSAAGQASSSWQRASLKWSGQVMELTRGSGEVMRVSRT